MLALGRTIVPGLLTACAALAAVPAVTLNFQLDASGAVSVTSFSRQGNLQFAPLMAAVIGCRGRMTAVENVFGHFRCPDALRRDGLVLEGVFDFSPIAQHLAAGDEIQLSVSYPRLGFAESSAPLPTETHGRRLLQSGPIPANSPAVRIRFGYIPLVSARTFSPLHALSLSDVYK